MILKKSRQWYFFRTSEGVMYIFLLLIICGFALDYLPVVAVGYNLKYTSTIVDSALTVRKLIEVSTLLYCILVEYAMNARLVWTSVKSGKSAALGSSSSANNNSAGLTSARQEAVLIASQKKRLATKMVALFLILLLFESAVAALDLVTGYTNIDNYTFEMFLVLTGSWLSFRVYAMFLLLDLFLSELKNVPSVVLLKQLPAQKNKLNLLKIVNGSSSSQTGAGMTSDPTRNSFSTADAYQRIDQIPAIESFSGMYSHYQRFPAANSSSGESSWVEM